MRGDDASALCAHTSSCYTQTRAARSGFNDAFNLSRNAEPQRSMRDDDESVCSFRGDEFLTACVGILVAAFTSWTQ